MSEITTEIWKPIDGYREYKVSNFGRVKHNERLINPYSDKDGYQIISVKHPKKLLKVHRLVGMAFIPNPENKPQINHIDYNRANNVVTNLEWVTPKENTAHSLCHFPKEKPLRSPTGEKYVLYNKANHNYRLRIKGKNYGSYQTFEDAVSARDKILNGEEFVYQRYTEFYKKPKKQKTNTGEHHIHKRKDGFFSVQYMSEGNHKSKAFKDFKDAVCFRDMVYEKHSSERN